MLSRPYGVPRWRHVKNSMLVQCTGDGNEGLLKVFQIFGYIASVIIINNYRSVYYVSQDIKLTLRLLISYIYGAPSKARNTNVVYIYIYIYGSTFGNAETVSFYLLHNVSTLNQCREVSCVTFVCKHFAS